MKNLELTIKELRLIQSCIIQRHNELQSCFPPNTDVDILFCLSLKIEAIFDEINKIIKVDIIS